MRNLKDATFDCAINTQVVHHLSNESDFAALRAACKEWHRVLKPGGKLVINFVTHRQQKDGVWWGELVPDAIAAWQAKAPDQKDIEAALCAAGFAKEHVTFEAVTPLRADTTESLYNDAVYMDPNNFLDIEEFRRSDSTFALSTDDEIAAAVQRVRTMRDEKTLNAWFLEKEKVRRSIGMTTNAYAIKGCSSA